jgi:predicted NBD/HSP70 family sugar kinase
MTNTERVVRVIGASGPLTRAQLADLLGLSRATVARLVDALVRDGVLEEAAAGSVGPGRPARALRLASPRRGMVAVLTWSPGELRTGIGTAGGGLLATQVIAHDGDTLEGLLSAATESIGAMAGGARLDGVVFGVPAPFRPGEGLPPIPELRDEQRRFPAWLASDPAPRVQARLGAPAIVENDANLGALGEHHGGAARGADTAVYVKLGPHAVGAGLIIGRRLHRGVAGFAGELAHVQVRSDGPPCVCGGHGCLVGVLRTDVFVPGTDLRERAAREAAPRRFLRDLGRTLGRPLADLATLLNPGLIVVDGSLGHATEPVAGGIREAIDRHAAPTAADTVDVRPGELGEHAELIGGLHRWRLHALAEAGIAADPVPVIPPAPHPSDA